MDERLPAAGGSGAVGGEVLINGDEHVEAPRHGIEKRFIIEIRPSHHLRRGSDLVLGQLAGQAAR